MQEWIYKLQLCSSKSFFFRHNWGDERLLQICSFYDRQALWRLVLLLAGWWCHKRDIPCRWLHKNSRSSSLGVEASGYKASVGKETYKAADIRVSQGQFHIYNQSIHHPTADFITFFGACKYKNLASISHHSCEQLSLLIFPSYWKLLWDSSTLN